MKKLSIILSFLILNISFSQNVPLVKIQYIEKVVYSQGIINNDVGDLYISKDEILYKTTFDNVDSEDNTDSNSIVVASKASDYFSEILIDRNSKVLVENLFERYALKKHFAVTESIPVMQWKLLKGEKKIGSFLCKNAETTFRGRIYNVWYTEKIPISFGPWKFNGLPGLILSATDSEGIYNWEAKTINYPFKGVFDFVKAKAKYKNFTKISFQKFDERLINEMSRKFSTIVVRNNQRNTKPKIDFSTKQWKEPTNEWRSIKDYKF